MRSPERSDSITYQDIIERLANNDPASIITLRVNKLDPRSDRRILFEPGDIQGWFTYSEADGLVFNVSGKAGVSRITRNMIEDGDVEVIEN